MRRRWRADYPKSRCRRPLRRFNPHEDKGDESSQREEEIGRRKRDLRATAHSIRESSMKGLCFMLRC